MRIDLGNLEAKALQLHPYVFESLCSIQVNVHRYAIDRVSLHSLGGGNFRAKRRFIRLITFHQLLQSQTEIVWNIRAERKQREKRDEKNGKASFHVRRLKAI